MTQFIQVETPILHNQALNSDEKLALSLIMDRMKSSVKRSEFFDRKRQAHYVIYSVDELAQTLNIGKNTAVKILKHLATLGLIIKQRVFSHATRIFLPDTKPSKNTQSLHSTITKSQKVTSNQNTFNQNKSTDDTNDTNNNVEKLNHDALDTLAAGLVQQGGLPKRLVEILQVYAFGSRDKLYEYASLIFKAKHAVSKRASRFIENAYSPFRFEINHLLTEKLTASMQSIIVNANRKAHNPNGYIMRACMQLFDEQANAYLAMQ
ncbi:hypothetical protein FD06_GL000726 [Apilactobacillus ozensis DSM 23829 = JCM 17196]|uniref:Replication initiator protein A C-terminal domain-containing protein n=1 Tax=Apilactobacillus ozensis DSM 23829 = JCM 17196 TaxID=1423781 RepID=A0A0R2AKZ9_9LACO|nr:replication initiator protein A [Apilactobacillus ozensis]KRM67575.1 hypothetical protein FD06_GL000726 [Apilactobacillus ozensis DSM 23829 = JCM 17196]